MIGLRYVCICLLSYCCLFFCKQKAAYEMRISDWSSDVCSSDLYISLGGGYRRHQLGTDWHLDQIYAAYKLGNWAVYGGLVEHWWGPRSAEHTSELQSLMRHSSAGICLNQKNQRTLRILHARTIQHLKTTESIAPRITAFH